MLLFFLVDDMCLLFVVHCGLFVVCCVVSVVCCVACCFLFLVFFVLDCCSLFVDC